MAYFNGKRICFSPKIHMIDETMWNTYWTRTGEEFTLPHGMTEVPAQMFKNYSTLVKMNLPETITKIGQYAFDSCKSFMYINLPDSITDIEQYAFYNNSMIELNALPPNLKNINSGVFANCHKVKFRSLPNTIKEILAYAFTNCTVNNTAVIPASVTKIDVEAFENNLGITEITFLGKPSIVNISGKEVFRKCTNLKKINVPWGEGEVPGAPWGAENAEVVYDFWTDARVLPSFTFPSGMTEIPHDIFEGNVNIQYVTLGDEVTAIRPAAFENCTNLKSVNFPDGLFIIEEHAFLGCPNLVVEELPDTIDEIEVAAFAGTKTALSKLPKNIRKLEDDCFDLCRGNTFTVIPKGVITIGARAFKENTGLTTLTFEGKPQYGISATAFVDCSNLTDIYVPWGEGEVANAPWGSNATIHYNCKEE